jgi:hypothetical protein
VDWSDGVVVQSRVALAGSDPALVGVMWPAMRLGEGWRFSCFRMLILSRISATWPA